MPCLPVGADTVSVCVKVCSMNWGWREHFPPTKTSSLFCDEELAATLNSENPRILAFSSSAES